MKPAPPHNRDTCGLGVTGSFGDCAACVHEAQREAARQLARAKEAGPEANAHLRRLAALLELATTWPTAARPGVTPSREAERRQLVGRIAAALVEATP